MKESCCINELFRRIL